MFINQKHIVMKSLVTSQNNLIQYKPVLKAIFEKYIVNYNNIELIQSLKKLERKIKRENKAVNGKAGLWIRFFSGDTFATTIENIENDLRYVNSSNYSYFIQNVEILIESDTFEIHYS
jgi:hypothetical protein